MFLLWLGFAAAAMFLLLLVVDLPLVWLALTWSLLDAIGAAG